MTATTQPLVDWQAPDKLAELAKTATRISIAAGEQKTMDVTIR